MIRHPQPGPTAAARRNNRDAYTLIEMLIVLAVMAGTIGLSWPAVRKSLAKSRLRHAARQVQTELNKLRSQAMRSGKPLMLRYQEQGNLFQVTTAHPPAAWNAPQPQPDTRQSPSRPPARAVEHRSVKLPDGIRFQPARHANQPSLEIELTHEATAQPIATMEHSSDRPPLAEATQRWSRPIVCYPDGRTSDAHIVLAGQHGFVMEVTLRGLTGIITTHGPNRERQPSSEPLYQPLNSRIHTDSGRTSRRSDAGNGSASL